MNSKKILIAVATLSLLVTIVLISTLFNVDIELKKDDSIKLNFTDSVVCNTIAKDLQKECIEKTVSFTQDEIDNYTKLELTGDIISLNGIEKFKNLKVLNITNANNLADISSLKELVNLQELSIKSDNNELGSINDISPLSNLTKLTKLNLKSNTIEDITPLSNLNNLQTLDISNNNISDLTALINLTQLESLDISNNMISSVTELSNLNSLSTLKISGNSNLQDISTLTNLTGISSLDITDTSITDLKIFETNGNIKIEKKGLTINPNVSQVLDTTLFQIPGYKDDYIVEGPCSLDWYLNLTYNSYQNPNNEKYCYVSSPKKVIRLEYYISE